MASIRVSKTFDRGSSPFTSANLNIMERGWKEYCKSCKKTHIFTLQPCPDCGTYYTPQPKSTKVNEKCKASKRCDGCDAYLDHLK